MKHFDISNDNPLVSIVMPCYNGERYVAETLNSLVSQMLSDIEIIVVNDGSTDNSKAIIEKFFFDRRLRYFEKPNGGTGDALNYGHRMARGRYITWCSADNIYFPNFTLVLAKCIMEAERNGVSYVYSDFCFMDANGRKIQDVLHQAPQPPEDLANGYDLGISFMYTKDLWLKTGEFWNEICEDFHWSVRAAQYTRFGLVKQILAAFRVHPGQISGNRKQQEKNAADACKSLAKEFINSGAYDRSSLISIATGFNPRLVE